MPALLVEFIGKLSTKSSQCRAQMMKNFYIFPHTQHKFSFSTLMLPTCVFRRINSISSSDFTSPFPNAQLLLLILSQPSEKRKYNEENLRIFSSLNRRWWVETLWVLSFITTFPAVSRCSSEFSSLNLFHLMGAPVNIIITITFVRRHRKITRKTSLEFRQDASSTRWCAVVCEIKF